jgi:hypothetical protein
VVVPNYGAGVVTDPKVLPLVISGTSQFYDFNGAAVALYSGVPPDHNASVAITSTSTVNLLTVNGSGFIYDIITPNGDAGSSSLATVTINIDGVISTITTTAGMSATQRLLIGPMIEINPTAPRILAKIGKIAQSSGCVIPTIGQVASLSQARVRFNYFCSVDIKMSVVPVLTGSFGNNAMGRFTND